MGKTCVAANCTNRSDKMKNISFHSFPEMEKKPSRYSEWVRQVKRTRAEWNGPTSKHTFVYSDHFSGMRIASKQSAMKEKKHSKKIKTFIFLDLEATGLPSSGRPRITEISLVAVHRCILEECAGLLTLPRALDKFTACVCPMKPVTPQAATITGLHNDLLEYQKDFDDQLVQSINLFIQRHEAPVCLVAHNGVNFDFGLLHSEFESLEAKLPDDVLCVDSLNMFREIDEGMESEIVIGETDLCGTDIWNSTNKSAHSSFVNHVKRKLVYCRESYEVTSSKKDSAVHSQNFADIHAKQTAKKQDKNVKSSSLFDPIDVDDDYSDLCTGQIGDASNVGKDFQTNHKNSDTVFSKGQNTTLSKSNSEKEEESIFEGETLEYTVDEAGDYNDVTVENKTDSSSDIIDKSSTTQSTNLCLDVSSSNTTSQVHSKDHSTGDTENVSNDASKGVFFDSNTSAQVTKSASVPSSVINAASNECVNHTKANAATNVNNAASNVCFNDFKMNAAAIVHFNDSKSNAATNVTNAASNVCFNDWKPNAATNVANTASNCYINAATNVYFEDCSGNTASGASFDDFALRPVSPGMEEAINQIISEGGFDDHDENDFLDDDSVIKDFKMSKDCCISGERRQIPHSNTEAKPIQLQFELSVQKKNGCNKSLFKEYEELGKEFNKQDTNSKSANSVVCKSPPPVQRVTTLLNNKLQDQNCEKIALNEETDFLTAGNLKLEAVNQLSTMSKNISNTTSPSKHEQISSTPPNSSKPQSPWYTPSRMSNSPFKRYKYSYKLMDIHKRVLGWEPEASHTAEVDCLALLRICQKLCFQVCRWADKNAVPVDMIPSLYSKSPRKRKPLSQGVFPYKS